MATGLGVLRLPPRDFWSLTPRELSAALGILSQRINGEPLSRAALDALMRRYPDREPNRP